MLGPNGAGKSTLLGVLAGLLRPSEGHVRLGDADVTDVPPHRRGVGLLAQQALLFPHMTALANVAFGPRAHGVPRRDAEERARELLAAVDAAALEARRPAQMSGGQQQRVALARALAPDPDLLLLDEPLAALDVDAAPAMRSLLRRIVRDRKQTAVLVTHSALDALVLADRVVVLTEGGSSKRVPRATCSPARAARSPRGSRASTSCPASWRARPAHGRRARPWRASLDGVAEGEPGVAVFPPAAVAVYAEPPSGSPRNVLPVRLAALEPVGDLVRLRAVARPGGPLWVDGLAADVTAAAMAELMVEPGADLWFVVKAAEVAIHGVGGP